MQPPKRAIDFKTLCCRLRIRSARTLEDAKKARAEAKAKRDKKAAETLAKAERAIPDETAVYLANGETDHTKKPPKKSGGAK